MNTERHPDLFGGQTPLNAPTDNRSEYQLRRASMKYRKATPGETNRCKNCKHCQIWNWRAGRYYKCELIGLSNSEATDIRANSTCSQWTKSND